MDSQDEAARRLRETFQRERDERALEAQRESIAGTTTKPRRRLPLPRDRAVAWLIALVALAAISTPLVITGADFLQRFNISNTVHIFCSAVTDENYPAAYRVLSHRARQAVSESEFADAVQGVQLVACSANEDSESYRLSGNLATVTVTYVYADTSGSSTRDYGTMALVSENGGWYIDDMEGIDLSSLTAHPSR